MKYFISICAAIAIIGCGTNSEYKAQDGGGAKSDTPQDTPKEPSSQTYENKGGLTGVVFKGTTSSKVCFDTNENGKCDANEKSEKVFEGGKFSFEKSVSDENKNQILLAQISNNEYLSSFSNNITPYTTLVVNENLYNPNADNNTSKSIELLKAKFKQNLLKGEMPPLEEANKLYDVFKKALILQKDDTYGAIANAVDSIYKQNSLDPTITQTKQIKAKDLQGTTLSVSKKDNLTWEKFYKDESFMAYSSNENFTLTSSRWHNSLRIVDKNSNTLTKNSKFLDITGDRYAVDSSSGASEQILNKAVMDKNSNIFAILNGHGKNSANGLGVYKVSLNAQDIKYASVPKGESFFELLNANDIASFDEKIVLGYEKGLHVFSSNLTAPLKSLELGNIKVVSMSKDFIYASLNKRKNNSLEILDHNLNKINSINTNTLANSTSSNIYPSIIASNNEFVCFALRSISDENIANQVYIFRTSDFKLQKQLSLSGDVSALNISDDGKFLLANTYDKKLEIFELGNFTKTSQSLEKIPHGAFMKNNTIGVAYESGFSFFEAKQTFSSLTQADKEKWTNDHRK